MRCPRAVLPLLVLLVTGVPSVLSATRLSLPSTPDFRLPSGGSVNTVFPAATGGAAPYSYGVSGLPPGISFHASTRGASGTLPTVSSETTYRVTYSVTDGAGASASVSFSATVVPPPAPPPPPPPPPPPLPPPSSLSLPTIPDFTLPSGGSVDTVFPAATGGAPPYTYSVSGLPPGVTFAAGTRRASGTLPTVASDTEYTVTYSVRDGTGATASVTFTTTVTAPPPTSGPVSPPGPPPRPADPPTAPVDAVRVHTLPFTVSETGSGQKEYRFRLESSDQVTVSLTGMDRDIDCRVNDSRCTNRGGTTDDSWSGTLEAGTHTVTVYPFRGGSGSWTLSVNGTVPPPQPPPSDPEPPDSGPSDHASRSRTYALRLSARFDVSVRLTGMTSDFDCRVGQSDCTNQSGTADDSWSGTLDAGEHKIVVYPRTGASGSYTLTVSVETPSTGGSEGTTTQVTTLVDVSRTGVSSSQTHGFALSGSAEVEVALTGLTIDFDCRVGSSRCTNRWGTRDDSWSGTLGEGNHSVVVYPYDPGPGNYSLTVTATTALGVVARPTGPGPGDVVCDQEGEVVDEDSCTQIPEGGVITVTGEDPGEDTGPPPGVGPGEGDPGPGDGGDGGGGGGGGGGGTETPTYNALGTLADEIDCRGWNIDAGDRYGATRTGADGTTYPHSGVDIQTNGRSAFRAPVAGTVTRPSFPSQAGGCGDPYVKLTLDDGSYFVFCHVSNLPAHQVTGRVEPGAIVGYDGFGLTNDPAGGFTQEGSTDGFHLHLGYRDSNGVRRNPLDVLSHENFTFNENDPDSCEE